MNIDYPNAPSRATCGHCAPRLCFPAGQEVPPVRVLSWLIDGWRAASAQPVLWLSIVLLCADFITLLGLLPPLRPLIVLVAPLAVGALIVAQDGARQTGLVSLRAVYAAVKRHSNSLCMIGLYATAIVAIGYVVMLATFNASLVASVTANGTHNLSISYGGISGVRGTLETVAGASIYAVAVAAACFAPALVVQHDMTPLDAMIASLTGTMRNWPVTLACFLVTVLAMLVMPTVPFAVRAFVSTPVLCMLPLLAIHGAYRDIFVGANVQS